MDKTYNKNSVNNVINGDTLLNIHIRNKKDIQELINIGANVNGISNCGITKSIPSTNIFNNNFDFEYNKNIINTLILNKLDVNSFDFCGNTLLTSYCDNLKTINNTTISELVWLLSKGCEVNGTVFKNPLYILSSKNNFTEYMNDIILLFKLYELTNVEFYDINGNVLKPINLYNHFNKKFNNSIIQTNTTDYIIQNEINNLQIIEIIKLIYKINNLQNIKTLKNLINNPQDLNFIKEFNDKLYNKVYFNNNKNNETLNYNELNEFNIKELIICNENNIQTIFHLSEIPILFKLQINPYTTLPLSVEFKNNILNKCFIFEKTLSELYFTNESSKNSVGYKIDDKNLNLFNFLKTLVNSFNIYINVDNLKELSYNQLYETLLVLHMGNKNEMYKNINNIDLFNSKNNENKMFNIVVKYLIKEIQNNKLNLVSNVIDQVLNDVNTINEFLKIFPQKHYNSIKGFIATNYNYNDSYDNFLNYISKICILLDSSLINNMNKLEIINNNKFYINEKITDVLSFRSKDNINNTWKDLINMLYASL